MNYLDPGILELSIKSAIFVFFCGLAITVLVGILIYEHRLYMKPSTFQRRYFFVDGMVPSIVGGLFAIFITVLLSIIALAVLYFGALFIDPFTQQDFRMHGSLVAALAMYGSYILFLEAQRTIRTSKLYLRY